MMRNRHVWSVASHGGEYMFYVIEAVLLLNHEDPADTTITFLPFEPPLARWFIRLRKRLTATAGASPAQDGSTQANTLYAQVQSGSAVQIDRGSYRITLQRTKLSRYRALLSWFRAAGRARRLWSACFRASRFQPLQFLAAKYKGVQIGDLAASTYFRISRYADELQPRFPLFITLWWCCWLIDITEDLVDTSGPEAYTITPEPNYVHSAPSRYLRSRGAKLLDIYQPTSPLVVLNGTEDVSRPRMLSEQREATRVAIAGEDAVAKYFEERFRSASTLLWYMSHGSNDNEADAFTDIDLQPVELSPDELYAVVFLHSFADSQYYFGLDGFQSLGDWTYETIEACLANPGFHKVLIKPHPNANYDVHPNDQRAFDKLISRYRRHPRVVVLSPPTSVVSLCRAAQLVGFTHHGSIAEELVYLRQPVIASTFAWWSDRYRFARLWSNPAELRALIAQQSKESWTPPTLQERAELYRYLSEFRFREVPCDRTFPAFVLARLRGRSADGHPVRLNIEEETAYSRELENLNLDDPEFEQLLNEFAQIAEEPPVLWPLTQAG